MARGQFIEVLQNSTYAIKHNGCEGRSPHAAALQYCLYTMVGPVHVHECFIFFAVTESPAREIAIAAFSRQLS
jgi:hypothetical protein